MKVDRKELLNLLEKLNPALSKSEFIEQGDSFIFSDGKVTTFNDEIMVLLPAPAALKKLNGAVKATEFYSLLKKHKTKEVGISVEKNELIVSTKNSKAGIIIDSEVKKYEDETEEAEEYHKLPENFLEAINMASLFVSHDISLGVLTFVYVKEKYVYASDNLSILRFNLSEEVPAPFLLDNKYIRLLNKYSVTEYGLTEGWLHFRNEQGVTFKLRLVDLDYPALDEYLETDEVKAVFELPNEIIETLERAGIFTSNDIDFSTVMLKAKDGKLIIESKGDYGWYKERFKINSKEIFAFTVPAESLKTALKYGTKFKLCESFVLLENEKFTQSLCLVEN